MCTHAQVDVWDTEKEGETKKDTEKAVKDEQRRKGQEGQTEGQTKGTEKGKERKETCWRHPKGFCCSGKAYRECEPRSGGGCQGTREELKEGRKMKEGRKEEGREGDEGRKEGRKEM